MRRTLIAIAAACLTVPVSALVAQGDAPQFALGQPDPALVKAGSYATDPHHTLVGWRVNHLGFNDYFGIFGDVTGTLDLDPANLSAAKVDVTIPVASVTTASAGLTEHLLRAGKDGGKPDFFGPSPAPARFVSTMVTPTGPMTAQIVGDLTLNGVTAPVAINATFTGAGPAPMSNKETVGFEGRALLKRSTFGIDMAIPLVSDEVELDITAAFEKQ
ncbi:YceI family protein [Croceicoccus naphthovorans]|uniref:Uncharacterized protein n=1 Tax=Croceicoccus naphthovorans TaxID=1348774 RepID=A0A0G3XEX9_9SPHN|nr:YceI family protein [Croceicoccus naphthovorans]AKM09757.1 hypothetical protein AB433_06825 [Croceicoccus naphthovorans]MBB3990697.1 polyisoprenoid-binding protein YceI [Croceicoccus naphthovorans]